MQQEPKNTDSSSANSFLLSPGVPWMHNWWCLLGQKNSILLHPRPFLLEVSSPFQKISCLFLQIFINIRLSWFSTPSNTKATLSWEEGGGPSIGSQPLALLGPGSDSPSVLSLFLIPYPFIRMLWILQCLANHDNKSISNWILLFLIGFWWSL